MVIKILLVISIILQLVAASIAIKLTRVTKYNFSWILITVALTAMILQRCLELIQFVFGKEIYLAPDIHVWIGIITSLCFAVGVFLIRKILNYITMIENKRRLYERRILNAIIQTEEKERQRFSKEIHDGLGPLLSSVKMSVSALDKMNTDGKQDNIIKNTNLVIDEAIRCLKEISNNLNPHVLTNFGLVRAINNFINKLAAFSKVKTQFTNNFKDKRFEPDVEVILYRVVCEMINNTLKHADATQIKLDMTFRNDEINLIFEDNGRGFNPQEVIDTPGGGMGLSNIISRVSSIKGEVDIFSEHGKGVRITIKAKAQEIKVKV